MCEKLGVSCAGYYAWSKRPKSERARTNALLSIEVKAAHKKSRGTYGSQRLTHELRANEHVVGRNRIIRIMRENGVSGRRKRKFVHTTNSTHAFPVAENLLLRDFEAAAPNQEWVGDITYMPTNEGWLYLSALVHLFSRKIVGHATSPRISTSLPLAALNMILFRCRPLPGLIHHTDRGRQYASKEYRQALEAAGILCSSMSHKGKCWDNAPGESIFARITNDLVYRTKFESRMQGEVIIDNYIEILYNPGGKRFSVGFMSPNVYEKPDDLRQRRHTSAVY